MSRKGNKNGLNARNYKWDPHHKNRGVNDNRERKRLERRKDKNTRGHWRYEINQQIRKDGDQGRMLTQMSQPGTFDPTLVDRHLYPNEFETTENKILIKLKKIKERNKLDIKNNLELISDNDIYKIMRRLNRNVPHTEESINRYNYLESLLFEKEFVSANKLLKTLDRNSDEYKEINQEIYKWSNQKNCLTSEEETIYNNYIKKKEEELNEDKYQIETNGPNADVKTTRGNTIKLLLILK